MRVFAGEVSGAIGARLVPQLIEHGHKVTGTCRSPRSAERVMALGAGPIALDQQPTHGWRRMAVSS
jgi:uncharacterized protein YbjT (DUF2867 family)